MYNKGRINIFWVSMCEQSLTHDSWQIISDLYVLAVFDTWQLSIGDLYVLAVLDTWQLSIGDLYVLAVFDTWQLSLGDLYVLAIFDTWQLSIGDLYVFAVFDTWQLSIGDLYVLAIFDTWQLSIGDLYVFAVFDTWQLTKYIGNLCVLVVLYHMAVDCTDTSRNLHAHTIADRLPQGCHKCLLPSFVIKHPRVRNLPPNIFYGFKIYDRAICLRLI